jgi:type I pantothenate kinase
LIVEGLNVLQPAGPGQDVALSDYFDFKIFVDAETSNITEWFLNRFYKLRESAFTNPNSYFHRYAEVPVETGARARQRNLANHKPAKPDRKHFAHQG